MKLQELWTNPLVWIFCVTIVTGIGSAIWWASSTHNTLSSVKGDVRDIRHDIKRIFDVLLRRGLTDSSSPITLNELGKSVSDQVKAKDWAKATAQELSAKTKSMSKEFEIHQFCENYVRREFKPDDKLKALIQEVAYNNGVSTTSVLDVFSIELRDFIIAQKSEIHT